MTNFSAYNDKWGFPMCAGAIDGTHIPIETPQKDHAAYVNRKSYRSVAMQPLVGGKYLFRDIVVGWPGSVQMLGYSQTQSCWM